MYSREQIKAAFRARGHTDAEISEILKKVTAVKKAGLIQTSKGGRLIGLTDEGRNKLAELRASGEIPPRGC